MLRECVTLRECVAAIAKQLRIEPHLP